LLLDIRSAPELGRFLGVHIGGIAGAIHASLHGYETPRFSAFIVAKWLLASIIWSCLLAMLFVVRSW
jgi:hypothetical protein